jgi:hypothetical protein
VVEVDLAHLVLPTEVVVVVVAMMELLRSKMEDLELLSFAMFLQHKRELVAQ